MKGIPGLRVCKTKSEIGGQLPPLILRRTREGSCLRSAVAELQRAKQALPSANAREWPGLSRKTPIPGIPESFKQGMADMEGGRFVDLDAALTGRVPQRSMKYRFRASRSYAGTSKLRPVISDGCFIPRRNRSVGATSARIPSWQRNFAASSAT